MKDKTPRDFGTRRHQLTLDVKDLLYNCAETAISACKWINGEFAQWDEV